MKIEKLLIEACCKQERKAQFLLYKECYGVLMSICFRYKFNKEDAEEILNIGFLKILNNIDKYKFTTPFEAWIRRIMINTVIDEYRKTKKDKEHIEYADFQESNYENKHSELNTADLDFEAADLLNMLEQLPNMTKKVFNLYAIDGFAHKEIAEMLNMSIGTSKWHVSTARAELKKMIEKNELKKK
jgi:RNA polymerase sigma factor (sigma-70 family)